MKSLIQIIDTLGANTLVQDIAAFIAVTTFIVSIGVMLATFPA